MTFQFGYPVYIATREFQRRKHRKKRINKKWRKRYGCRELNLMAHGEVIFNEVDKVFYMTKRTFEQLTKDIPKQGVRKNERNI